MAFFRGGKRKWDGKGTIFGLLHARKQLREGTWPIGRNDDKSILWQDNPRKEHDDYHYIREQFVMGDYLVYGWKRLSAPVFIISYFLIITAIVYYIWPSDEPWVVNSSRIALIFAPIGIYYSVFAKKTF